MADLISLIIKPGAVAADAEIDFPSWAPKAERIHSIKEVNTSGAVGYDTLNEYTRELYDGSTSAATVFQQKDEDTFILGAAIAATDYVIVFYSPKGELQGKVGGDTSA